MSIGTVLGFLKALLDLILKIPIWINEARKAAIDKEAEERVEAIMKAQEAAKNATTIEEKADAACQIEMAIDPSSTCDTGKQ